MVDKWAANYVHCDAVFCTCNTNEAFHKMLAVCDHLIEEDGLEEKQNFPFHLEFASVYEREFSNVVRIIDDNVLMNEDLANICIVGSEFCN